jgi:4'-phosphopantetheinyl transferase EntD
MAGTIDVTDADAIDSGCATLFPAILDVETRFGRCVVVRLPPAGDTSATAIATLLHRQEQALCRDMRRARLIAFAGGRLAAMQAKQGTAAAGTPTLMATDGTPIPTNGVAVSISHSRTYAAALTASGSRWDVGVDIETLEGCDTGGLLAERILSDTERAADTRCVPIPVLWRLSFKEAAYKALFPSLGHIPLRHIEITRPRGAMPGFTITVAGRETRMTADAMVFRGHVLSFAAVSFAAVS